MGFPLLEEGLEGLFPIGAWGGREEVTLSATEAGARASILRAAADRGDWG